MQQYITYCYYILNNLPGGVLAAVIFFACAKIADRGSQAIPFAGLRGGTRVAGSRAAPQAPTGKPDSLAA
ncbi:MAG: hypothetical protein LBP86_03830, partial [Azoarcus sp.]|nr:hypothetical protein [Azoarcus sp.]